MRIGIIGAGIGGLVAALGLQRDGHDVTVFERQERPGVAGAGLSLFANSFAALDAIGLADLVLPLTTWDAPLLRSGLRTPSGCWSVVLPAGAATSVRALHRADLHAALVGALLPGSLRTGVEASVRSDGSATVTVRGPDDRHDGGHDDRGRDESDRDEGGRDEPCDLVVAADGIQSRARTALGLDTGVRYAGYTAWRGVTRSPVDVGGEAGETWGRGKRFGVVPLPDGRVYWFATQTLPPGTTSADERQEVLRQCGSWHDPIRALVEATDTRDVLRHDVCDLRRPLRSYAKGATILLGDAAHAMTPDMGQGAGQAIEDAATLVLLLRAAGASDGPGIAQVTGGYDRARRGRSQQIARRSRAAGKIGQLTSPVAIGVRHTAMRIAPARLAVPAAARLQRWQPPEALGAASSG